jgi:hypothetical protein
LYKYIQYITNMAQRSQYGPARMAEEVIEREVVRRRGRVKGCSM